MTLSNRLLRVFRTCLSKYPRQGATAKTSKGSASTYLAGVSPPPHRPGKAAVGYTVFRPSPLLPVHPISCAVQLPTVTYPAEAPFRRAPQISTPHPKSPAAIRAASPTPNKLRRRESAYVSLQNATSLPTPAGSSPYPVESATRTDRQGSRRGMPRWYAADAHPSQECSQLRASTARESTPRLPSQGRKRDGSIRSIPRCRPRPG